MFFSNHLDDEIEKNENEIKIVSQEIEDLENKIDEFLKITRINLDKVSLFVENKENFSEENWEKVMEQKKHFDEKLQCDLLNVKNPIKTKKARASLRVKQHWLHVR